MTISSLVTYDAICAAIAGRMYMWLFREVPGYANSTFEEVNRYQADGTLILCAPLPVDAGEVFETLEIYLVRWSDGQYTLERIF